ncbi:MAG TPA: CAP domain-containing protein [Candidatus Paceibacterota bacterium]|nr:CAP domain-containing protein [Candidatus Paceibacterota bacterium]
MLIVLVLALFALPFTWIEDAVSKISIEIPANSAEVGSVAFPLATTSKKVATKLAENTTQKPAPSKKTKKLAQTDLSPSPSTQSPPTTQESAPPSPTHATAPRQEAQDFRTLVEYYIFEKTNIERAKHELSALAPDPKLTDIARSHSKDMLTNNYFDHEDPQGCSASCRAKNASYTYWSIGENIYMMKGYNLSAEATAQRIVDGWMNSPGHRANILRDSYTHSGIGVVAEGRSVYATAMYSKPR